MEACEGQFRVQCFSIQPFDIHFGKLTMLLEKTKNKKTKQDDIYDIRKTTFRTSV